MTGLLSLTVRNCKLFFKDKGIFLASLITPVILLVLYVTFLASIYRDSFTSVLPEDFEVSSRLLNGAVGTQLISAIVAVSCITVAFCSNLIMIQDKVTGSRTDLTIAPIKPVTLSLSYYLATVFSTMIIALFALGAGFIYLGIAGWYLSAADVFFLILDAFLLVLFGTALSSILNFFLSTEGQMSAVGTIVSAGYGFICGAYMPLASFNSGLRNVLMFLPGTYGTSLVRNHAMRGVLEAMGKAGFPDEAILGIRDSLDCNIYFLNSTTPVPIGVMYAVLIGSIAVLIGIYIIINVFFKKKAR